MFDADARQRNSTFLESRSGWVRFGIDSNGVYKRREEEVGFRWFSLAKAVRLF